MQKARRHPSEDGLRPLVSARFQVLLTSLIGELFNIRSTYWFAIGRQVVFSLGGWTPQLHVGFHEPGATLVRLDQSFKPLQDYHLLWLGFHSHIHGPINHAILAPATPSRRTVWAIFRFRSPLLTESRFLYFPLGTKMFQFPRLASIPYTFRHGFPDKSGRVSPFGHPRITAWLPAPLGFSQAPTSFIAS